MLLYPSCLNKVSSSSTTSLSPQPETPIRSQVKHLCVVPEKPGCSAADLEGSSLVFKKMDEDCTAVEAQFLFDEDGVMHHKCSRKMVCPEGMQSSIQIINYDYNHCQK